MDTGSEVPSIPNHFPSVAVVSAGIQGGAHPLNHDVMPAHPRLEPVRKPCWLVRGEQARTIPLEEWHPATR